MKLSRRSKPSLPRSMSSSARNASLIFGWAVVLQVSATAFADPIVVVADETREAIQAALDELGGPGTVWIPPGRYLIEPNATLVIRSSGVTLQGSGVDQTILYRDIDTANTVMVRSSGLQRVRVTGIRFEGVTAVDSAGMEVGVQMNDTVDFRVDNCFFTRTGRSGVWTSGSSSGVVDHCQFEDLYKTQVANLGYGVEVGGSNVSEQEPFGSPRATFIEDSSFRLCRHAVASNRGARYVFRYNYVAQNQIAHAVDAHGHEFGSRVGTEWIDVHDNLIEDPADPTVTRYAIRIRGGMGLVWNNWFVGYNQGIELTQDTDQVTGPIYIWDNSIFPATNPMVDARGTMGDPVFLLSPPPDYVPYSYPHPLNGDDEER